MHTAEIYQFPARQAQEQPEGKRGAQLEDGYTRIPNPIMDALCCADFNPREFRVVHFVIRETYGWQLDQKRMSGEYIASKVKLDPSRCSKVLNELIRRDVLVRHGGSRSPVSLNKHVEEWQPRVGSNRQPPTRCAESAQNGPSESAQHGPAYKEKKDIHMNTYVFIAHRLPANALVDLTKNHFKLNPVKRKAKASLPSCPHMEILDLWAEIMPDKQQPAKNLWAGTTRQRDLANRWKAGFTIKHERTGKPLYSTREEGIAWWGRFFAYLRKSNFLMQDHRWFKLDWVVNKTNFTKIMELSYHGQEGQA